MHSALVPPYRFSWPLRRSMRRGAKKIVPLVVNAVHQMRFKHDFDGACQDPPTG